jgi:outer membrane receptor for ferrienterochelin and colicins
VEENRYETIGSYIRTLGEAWAIRLAMGGEYSRIAQVGNDGRERDFWRPKGSVSAGWTVSPQTAVNLSLQRRVGQLNFFDFLATVNLADDVENAANPDLRPPQLWEAEVEIAQSLGEFGTTMFRVYGHRIDDIVDIVPIGEDGEAPGNIDRARRYGAEWKNTLDLAWVGWDGAKLDTRLLWQTSRVRDPLTGESREISRSLRNLASVSLRSDPPGSPWAWGTSASYVYEARNYRLTEVGRLWEGPIWARIFIEHKDVMGLTVRGTLGNVLDATSMWDRTVHDGRRTESVAFVEQRDRKIGPIFTFSIRGRF